MFTPKTVPLLALSLTSALLLTSCSSGGFGDLKETVVDELETIVENENNPNANSLPVVEVDNVDNANMEIVDNESNRKVAALTLEEVLTDIASFKVDEESELLEVEKHLGTYADLEVEKITTAEAFKEKIDTEELVDKLAPAQKEQILGLLSRYAPQPGISNYEYLNDSQKITILNYLGNRKTEFNYQYALHKLSNPTEYKVDPEKMVFRENDIIVFPTAISHNHNDVDFKTDDYYPYRIIEVDGKYVVDIFHTALIASSPLVLKAGFADSAEDWLEISDKTLKKDWSE